MNIRLGSKVSELMSVLGRHVCEGVVNINEKIDRPQCGQALGEKSLLDISTRLPAPRSPCDYLHGINSLCKVSCGVITGSH